MILAIDPGGRAGYAAFEEERAYLRQSGFVNGDSVKEARFILELFKPSRLVIEDQFIPVDQGGKSDDPFRKRKRRVMNQKGLKTLLLRRHIWEVLAMDLGIKVDSVNPRTWQKYFNLKAGDKEGICKLAGVLTGKDTVEDESDAILIGQWWCYNHK